MGTVGSPSRTDEIKGGRKVYTHENLVNSLM